MTQTASSVPPAEVPPPRKPPEAVRAVLRGVAAGAVNCLLWVAVTAWLVSWREALFGLLFQPLPAAGIASFYWARGWRWGAIAVWITSAIAFVVAASLVVAQAVRAPGGG